MKRKPKVILVDYGVASNFGSHIEINRELLEYPDLYDYVLEHELNHDEGEHTLHDIQNDFHISLKMVFRLIKFCIKRPKTWIEFLPVYKREGKIIYDTGMIISYSLLIFVLIIAAIIFL